MPRDRQAVSQSFQCELVVEAGGDGQLPGVGGKLKVGVVDDPDRFNRVKGVERRAVEFGVLAHVRDTKPDQGSSAIGGEGRGLKR